MKLLLTLVFSLILGMTSCKGNEVKEKSPPKNDSPIEHMDTPDSTIDELDTAAYIEKINLPVIEEIVVPEKQDNPTNPETEEEGIETPNPNQDDLLNSEEHSLPQDKTLEEAEDSSPVEEEIEEEQDSAESSNNELPAYEEFTHEILDLLLRKYVSATGFVDYAGFKSEEAKLDEYLDLLSKNTPMDYWTRKAEMAYWINAYNAFTIKLILNNYPVKSIMDLDNGKTWDVKWIKLGSKKYSLNQIEHEILRPKFQDARIHFAVNCAAKSCPPLLNGAWTELNLESNLESTTRKFINNPAYNTIEDKQITLSKIFDWYRGDFGDLRSYINTYTVQELGSKVKVKFHSYDWALNGK